MFDNIGWAEIFTIVVIGLIIIGPEKLPGVIKDVRAAVFAARRAITNARAELDGEFGSEFDEFREPINKVAEYGRMGPKAAITKALFDGDGQFLDSFDPKKIMASEETAGSAARAAENPKQTRQVPRPEEIPAPPHDQQNPPQSTGGFSWADVT
ncbi:Sec-independent protein translocase protein TatB [Corynebacterium sp. A21]|uniref:Sec-independent protein translocase protein TatB n=1 Tax=Corynebacterium sp. A21 TaxID=3457318 RepID=UPI003FD6A2CD